MTLRSFRERVIQTSSFELIGILFVAPIYAHLIGSSTMHGFILIALLSVAILVWAPIFNTAFDMIDRHFTNRPACKRPHKLRLVHATLHEVTAVMITCPLLIWVGGHTLPGALAVNFGLTVTYTIYTYVFHIIYDRLRPVAVQTPLSEKKPGCVGGAVFAPDPAVSNGYNDLSTSGSRAVPSRHRASADIFNV